MAYIEGAAPRAECNICHASRVHALRLSDMTWTEFKPIHSKPEAR